MRLQAREFVTARLASIQIRCCALASLTEDLSHFWVAIPLGTPDVVEREW